MIAIIETGGKQYKVSPEETLEIERLTANEGESVTFDKVLLVGEGENVKVGAPYVNGATVAGTVVKHDRGEKIRVFKYKAKSKYRRSQGHRQPYTTVKIDAIKA